MELTYDTLPGPLASHSKMDILSQSPAKTFCVNHLCGNADGELGGREERRMRVYTLRLEGGPRTGLS